MLIKTVLSISDSPGLLTAPNKINVLTQLVFTVYPITQNNSSSMYRSAN